MTYVRDDDHAEQRTRMGRRAGTRVDRSASKRRGESSSSFGRTSPCRAISDCGHPCAAGVERPRPEARSLLVRDRNKVVAIAAVTSPKITENELVGIAKSRNVGDEVIRIIARNKDVTRNYQVKVALATNPKTPQATAMMFVNYLQDRELRSLMKSKDVPSAISMHARRILMRKGKL